MSSEEGDIVSIGMTEQYYHGMSLISVREMETFNQIGSKARLIEVDSDGQRGNPPGEVDPKKPVHNPHEVNLALFR